MGDWENAYVTMSPAYEARQIEVFAKMYMDGMVHRLEAKRIKVVGHGFAP